MRGSSVSTHRLRGWILAAALSAACGSAPAQTVDDIDRAMPPAAAPPAGAVEAFVRALRAYEEKAGPYWQQIAEKRQLRSAKRRNHEPIELSDYVLTHPPVYSGPPRPPGYAPPDHDPSVPPRPIPVVADFLRTAAEQFHFVPDRPGSEIEFKRAYAKAAAAASISKDQAVRIYAFETGGNGTYDVQSGLTSRRPGARAISAAVGYNQLLNTNTIGLLAEHGDKFVNALQEPLARLTGNERTAKEHKIAVLQRMIEFSRSVPNAWKQHDNLAKTTPGGVGIHALLLDRDIGPLLQVQKLLDSVNFARMKGLARPLTAAELELLNFTGDGNGIDMVLMPQSFRERVPTANFFQRNGYARNSIARRTGTVAALIAAIEAKMDSASQEPGARELAEAF
jgi:hypothetical protein